MSSSTLLRADAGNRALRVFLVGFVIDVLTAVALVLFDALDEDDVDYRILPALLAKTAASSAGAYLLRRRLDPSSFPTPLPPEDPGRPADDTVEP